MKIRVATVEEMKKLWGYSDSPTYNYFVDGINSGNIEFWAIENCEDKKLIGELYIFWNSEVPEEANGINRAYLCAFRVEKPYQGKGLASKLMKRVLHRVKEKGFREVTIGIDNGDYERLKGMYNSWGFNELIKKQHYDYHYLDSDNNPVYFEETTDLYLNRLE
ncbi:GNAT family N-acetyltransferase [Clostridium sp. D2Q-11]|uniref:GNAT family N-acetyltransferase n=1 Tax=Anaeromonas frigoriresistens TaxID=2683708 RepID=A0A942UW42_9FIRM|nr:GNAT family N-acetyltransferase [Anaeromonas frigoriresistens]MBS4537496.1 GNAT family N-acetyltransferase [Anaeromonas frigoriresistens]